MAIEKIKVPEEDLDEMVMIYIAAAAIIFNIILAFVLHGSGILKIILSLFIKLKIIPNLRRQLKSLRRSISYIKNALKIYF